MSKVKIIWAAFGSLFLAAALVAALTLVPKKQSIVEKAAPVTVLKISPNSQNGYLNQNFSLSVLMDTGSNAVNGMDLELNFDPNVLQITSIAQGSAITNLTRVTRNPPIDNTAGKVIFSAYSAGTSVTGSNQEVLVVNGTVKSDASLGNTTLSFGSGTAVIALGEDGSVLQSKTSGTLTIVVAPPINGDWSDWSPASCPTACDLPASSQTRTCTNPAPAYGGADCVGLATSTCAATAGCAKIGDVNGDGTVNILDIGEIINNYGKTGDDGFIRSDLNKDGTINILDIGTVINNYGQ